MKVLVLGGNGFIGSHVVDELRGAGHSVRIFDRSEDRYRGRFQDVDYVLGSFQDTFLVAEALSDIDVVFHGISTTVPGTSNLDPAADVESNLISTLRLLRSMQDKGMRRIVFLSSGGTVYGNPMMDPIPEDHPLHPVCSYGIVKVAIENYLYMHQQLHGLLPIVLRPSNPYGERQGHQGVQGVVGTFLHKAQKDERIEIWGNGGVVRDFIYIGDLARLCLRAIEGDVCGVFNVGSGLGHTVNDVLGCVKLVSGKSLQVDYKPARGYDVPRVVLDSSRASRQFDWATRVQLLDGIARTWAGLLQRPTPP